jgi:hypothetical protein
MRLGTIRRSLLATTAALALIAGGLAAAPASAAAAETADVSVALIPQADTASLADGVDTYRVVVTNHGDADVKQITVSVPFAGGYSAEGASFDRGGAWVAQLGAASLDLRVEQMRGNGDSVSGTLRFVSQGAAPSNALIERATVTWSGDSSRARNLSNLPVSAYAGTVATAAALPNGHPAISFSAAAFASGEPVSLWYTAPSGESTALVTEGDVAFPMPAKKFSDTEEPTYGTSLAASSQGELLARIDIANLTPGSYTLAARGGWSGTVASATFTVR